MEKAKINFLETVDVELFKLHIHNLKWTAGLAASLAESVKKYGNKVYNVRFDKMLQAELDRYITDNPVEVDKWRGAKPYIVVREFTTKKLEIRLYGLKSSVYKGKDYNGYDINVNMPSGYNEYRIAYRWTDYPTLYGWASKEVREKELLYHNEKTSPDYFFIDDNGNIRINADRLAALLVSESKDTLFKVSEFEALLEVDSEGFTGIERDIQEYNRIKKEASDLCDRLSCTERDFFDIKAYATWH